MSQKPNDFEAAFPVENVFGPAAKLGLEIPGSWPDAYKIYHPRGIIEYVDFSKPIIIEAAQHDLELRDIRRPLRDLKCIVLKDGDAEAFGKWVKKVWQTDFESFLQVVGGGSLKPTPEFNPPIMSTFLPLVTFRETIGWLVPGDESDMGTIVQRLRLETRHWRDAGADVVYIHCGIVNPERWSESSE